MSPRPHAATLLARCILAVLLPSGLASARSLELSCPAGYLPGVPVLVEARILDDSGAVDRGLWDATATLESDPQGVTLSPSSVTLRNGRGSALVTLGSLPPSGTFSIVAASEGLTARRTLGSLAEAPSVDVSGTLPAGLTEWSGVIRVTDDVTVPDGATLRLLPGTLVLVSGVATAAGQPGKCQSPSSTPGSCGKSIDVLGAIECLGTEDEPVVITAADPAKAFGEIHHDGAEPSIYRHTQVTRAGNSPRGGHTNTGPTIEATNSRILFEGTALADGAGKAMQASGSDLEFQDCLLTRFVMGPEIDGTALLFEDSWVEETYGTDDNDGIYLHNQRAGQTITLRRSVFASGDDDGIDTLGAVATFEDCIIRDWGARFADPDSKGISILSGEVWVRGCLVANNPEGIVAKGQSTGARVHVDRTTVARTPIGLHAWDKYGIPDLRIEFFVKDTIVQADQAVITDYLASDIHVSYTDLSQAWPGDGNIVGDPRFADPAAGDYRLSEASPCIDAGDPASAPDPDGSRADMGCYPYTGAPLPPRFERGLVNDDDAIDISDPVALLVHLFAGGAIGCREAADANDDGSLDVSDAVTLLAFLFQGGEAPPPPLGACGPDPTPDALGCGAPRCP